MLRQSDKGNPLVRQTKNKSEQAFIDAAHEKGWQVIRKGWPDYLCFKQGEDGGIAEIMAVEVKPRHAEGLKFHQILSASILSGCGIECFVYGAQEGTIRKVTATPEV